MVVMVLTCVCAAASVALSIASVRLSRRSMRRSERIEAAARVREQRWNG